MTLAKQRFFFVFAFIFIDLLFIIKYEKLLEVFKQNEDLFYTVTLKDIYVRIPLLSFIYIIAIYGKSVRDFLINELLPQKTFLSFLSLHFLLMSSFIYLVLNSNFYLGLATLNVSVLFLGMATFNLRVGRLIDNFKQVALLILVCTGLVLFNRFLVNSYESSSGAVSWAAWPFKFLLLESVHACLSLFFNQIDYNFSQVFISVNEFSVALRYGCSGIQGISLFLICASVFYIVERRHFKTSKFAIVWLLLLGILFSLIGNIFRVSALIAIGAVGYSEWALGSFHSNAGVFIYLILIVMFCALLIHLYSEYKVFSSLKSFIYSNPVSPYIFPFIVLLSSSLFFKVFTPSWDIWYPIKMILVGVSLYQFKDEYKRIFSFSFHIFPIILGALITFIWFWVPIPYLKNNYFDEITFVKLIWILFKIVGSCLLIPIIEELVFRGFLLRFFIRVDFQEVRLGTYHLLSFLATSLIFGLLHQHYLAGFISGAILNASMYYRKSLFDAVVCHMVANIGVAFAVLYFQRWEFWM